MNLFISLQRPIHIHVPSALWFHFITIYISRAIVVECRRARRTNGIVTKGRTSSQNCDKTFIAFFQSSKGGQQTRSPLYIISLCRHVKY